MESYNVGQASRPSQSITSAARSLSDGAKAEQVQSAALTNGINERIQRMGAMAENLEALADRIVGSEPAKPAQTSDPRVMPSHLTARLDMCCEGLDFVANRIADALRRLERFA